MPCRLLKSNQKISQLANPVENLISLKNSFLPKIASFYFFDLLSSSFVEIEIFFLYKIFFLLCFFWLFHFIMFGTQEIRNFKFNGSFFDEISLIKFRFNWSLLRYYYGDKMWFFYDKLTGSCDLLVLMRDYLDMMTGNKEASEGTL